MYGGERSIIKERAKIVPMLEDVVTLGNDGWCKNMSVNFEGAGRR
jgi:hypothetical protein